MTVGELKTALEIYCDPGDDDTEIMAQFAHGDAGVFYSIQELSGIAMIADDPADYKTYALIVIGDELEG